MGQPDYRNGFKVTCHPDTLGIPNSRHIHRQSGTADR